MLILGVETLPFDPSERPPEEPSERAYSTRIRVSAIAITGTDKLVVIGRRRTGQDSYCAFPGGGVERTDKNLHEALVREVSEELGGEVSIGPLVHAFVARQPSGRMQCEVFFLCRLHSYSASGGNGPEWQDSDPANQYSIEELDLTEDSIRASNLVPESAVEVLLSERFEHILHSPQTTFIRVSP